jgi:tetratricopeptide (TPR) repeat protein
MHTPVWRRVLDSRGLAIVFLFAPFGVPISDLAAQVGAGKALDPAECESRWRLARQTFEGLPSDFRTMTAEEGDRLAARVEGAREACAFLLAYCKESEKSGEVHYFFGKFLHVLSARERARLLQPDPLGGGAITREEMDTRMGHYFATIARHAGGALERLAADSPLRAAALQLHGQALAEGKQHQKAIETYLRFLEEYPDSSEAPTVTAALARLHLDLGECEEGLRIAEAALEDPRVYQSDSYPFLVELLWKLNKECKGDLIGMLQAAETVLTIYPLRLGSSSLSPHLRESFERYLDYSGFRKGYALMGLGDLAAARQAFHEHIERMNDKDAKLAAVGQALKPESDIHRKRSVETLAFLETLAEQPAPADFDLHDLWVSRQKVSLESARGKVLGVVFRGAGESRSAGFIEEMDDFCRKEPDIELLTVCYLKITYGVQQQMDELREELASLGYESAAGFDPDAENKSLFLAYKVYVGSASFVVIDREGRPVFFQQDPTKVRVKLAQAVLRRVAGRAAAPSPGAVAAPIPVPPQAAERVPPPGQPGSAAGAETKAAPPAPPPPAAALSAPSAPAPGNALPRKNPYLLLGAVLAGGLAVLAGLFLALRKVRSPAA